MNDVFQRGEREREQWKKVHLKDYIAMWKASNDKACYNHKFVIFLPQPRASQSLFQWKQVLPPKNQIYG